MKKLVIFVFVILFLNFVLSAEKIDKAVIQDLKEDNEANVLIELKNPLDKPDNLLLGHDFGKSVSAEISNSDLNKLKLDLNIQSITAVPERELFLTESVPLVNATITWPLQVSGINITGLGETICILDTGANFSHPDLIGRNKTCVIDCTSECIENCSLQDTNGHGTHIAGIIGANGVLKGVAPEIGIIAVKVCPSNTCPDSNIRAGLDWCIANRNLYNISVISMSLGSDTLYNSYCDNVDDPLNLTLAINNATSQNISVIVATGNSANFTAIASPACIQNSTSVGDIYDANIGGIVWSVCTDTSTSADKIICHSNRNSITDLFAPGALINSTWKDGSYSNQGGTSMATPHVAAAFALIRQFQRLNNQKVPTPSEILSVLNSTGKTISDSVSGLTFSRIDIYSAILSLNITNSSNSISVNLIFPYNNTFTNTNLTIFNCSTQTSSGLSLSNVTLYLWNSTNNLIFNQSKTVAGRTNSSFFNYNLTYENSYKWNCKVYDNSLNHAFSNSNYTLIYDITTPNITLISPEENYSAIGTTSINFSFNVSDQNLANCSLLMNNVSDQTNSSINLSITNQFTKSLSAGSYSWKINCIDLALNEINSSSRSITINADIVSTTTSSGGGGGGGSTIKEKVVVNKSQNIPPPSVNQSKRLFETQKNISKYENISSENHVEKKSAGITGAVVTFIQEGRLLKNKFFPLLIILVVFSMIILISKIRRYYLFKNKSYFTKNK